MTTSIVTTVATASPAPSPTADASTPDALARELAHEQAMCNRGRDRYFNNCSRLQGRNTAIYKLEATAEAREWVEKHQEYMAGLTYLLTGKLQL